MTACDEIARGMATPEFHRDPYPLYARMRREHPVYRSSGGVWYLTRYADVDAALRDPRLSKDQARMRRWSARHTGAEDVARLRERFGRSMPHADPPDHTRLRTLVSKMFAARRMRDLRPRIEAIADGVLDDAVAAGRGSGIDVITALAHPLPITVICELVGVPLSDRDRIGAWSRQLVDQTEAVPAPEDLRRVERAADELEDSLRDLVRRRRADPTGDIVSALVGAMDRGAPLTEDELLSTCYLLIVAVTRRP